MKNTLIIPAGILALGLVVSSFLAAGVAQDIFALQRVVSVKGLSEQPVEANIAVWDLPFYARGDSLAQARAGGDAAQKAILAYFAAYKLAGDEVVSQPLSIRRERESINNNMWRDVYVISGVVRVRTANLDAMAEAARHTDKLLAQDITLGQQYGDVPLPRYIFTALNDVKPALIAAATQNARASAQQFATDSGSTLGGIARANQGVVSILSRDGDYNERDERFKTVRVVSSVDYFLQD